jgi:hypothetical protein
MGISSRFHNLITKDSISMKRFFLPALCLTLGATSLGALVSGPRAVAAQKVHKVAICHGTASAKNPYVLIIVDESAKPAHMAGHGHNSAPDYLLNNGNVLTPQQESHFRGVGRGACGGDTNSKPNDS